MLTSAGLLAPCFVSAQVTRPVTPDQIKASGLDAGYRLEEYYSEWYTARSRVGPVFFDREPIVFRLVITNVGSTSMALVLATMDAQRLFQVRGFVAPPLLENAPERRWFVDKYGDERAIALPLAFSSPAKAWAGGRMDIPLEREQDVRFSLSDCVTLRWA